MSIFCVIIGMSFFLYFMGNCQTLKEIMEVLYFGTKAGEYTILTILVHFMVYFWGVLQVDRLFENQSALYYMLRCRVKDNEGFLKIQVLELLKNVILLFGGKLVADCFLMLVFKENLWSVMYGSMLLFFLIMLILIFTIGLFMFYFVRRLPITNIIGSCVLLTCFIHILLHKWIALHFYSVAYIEIGIGLLCISALGAIVKNKIGRIERV